MAKAESKTAIVPAAPKSNLPAAWRNELAEEAKNVSATETPSSTSISFKSGVMAVGGVPVPGNTMPAIVVGAAFERAYYSGPYDANKLRSPDCFALSLDGSSMEPHENSANKQAEACVGCPMNEWGSAGNGRKGKACKEIRRIALIPADKLESTDDILAAEMAMAKVPVTSVGNWSNYVHKVSAMHSLPYWAVVTRITVKPHIKNQFEVFFDLEDSVEDIEALTALKTKRGLVESFVMAPYSPAGEEEEEPAKPAKFTKKR